MQSEVKEVEEYLNAWVIGGDGRYKWAVKGFRDMGIPVKTWGVPGEKNQASHLEEALEEAKLVLLPMRPFVQGILSVDGEAVEAALLPKLLSGGATLVAGSFPTNLEAWFQDQGIKCVNFLELESYLLKNAAVTAEGAVFLALKHMERTLMGANVLVVGWGRIGRFLAEKLAALGANTTVAVRQTGQKTELELLGFQTVTTGVYEDGLGKYDLVINTVPKPVIDSERFKTIRQDCVLIELASRPGGFPQEYLDKVVMGQALPGKTAPRTAGENLVAAVLSCLDGEGRTLE